MLEGGFIFDNNNQLAHVPITVTYGKIVEDKFKYILEKLKNIKLLKLNLRLWQEIKM